MELGTGRKSAGRWNSIINTDGPYGTSTIFLMILKFNFKHLLGTNGFFEKFKYFTIEVLKT